MTESNLHNGFSPSPKETVVVPLPHFTHLTGGGPSPPALKPYPSPPSNGAPTSPFNARSCTTCRKRKVRCDKRHPCSNCIKAGVECLFPGPGRAPRRSRKAPDTELLARLRRLEDVVQNLGKGIDDEGQVIEIGPAEESGTTVIDAADQDSEKAMTATALKSCGLVPSFHTKNQKKPNVMVEEFGRLVVDEGRSRYVSNKFWTSLSEEVAEMRDILDDPSDDEEDYPSPGSGSTESANNPGFIFSFSSTISSLRNFHPPLDQIYTYWNIYRENVHPLLRVFHGPHTEKVLFEAAQNLDHVSKPTEVMMFAIYYAAATSIATVDCMAVFAMEKEAALKKYRFAFEQALARADFLSTQELVVLQSLTLFLNCVRRYDDSRYVWTLTGAGNSLLLLKDVLRPRISTIDGMLIANISAGLAIRIAQALGVHRDGEQFGISPFQTELRRRLWWQICTLDVRASEDHGTDPSINDQGFDTKFPLNINDADIDPNSKEPPKERQGWTEMTFDMIRYSVCTTVRRLSYAPPGPGPCREKNAGLTLEKKERMIEELHQYLENNYLQYCDMTVPLHWVAATVSRLVMAKMWLIVHHPSKRGDGGAGLPQETQDRLFLTSVEVIEFSRLLETEKSTLKWGWLFRTYVQWHAVAFVVSQLCTRTRGPEVEKAWFVLEAVFDEWDSRALAGKKGMLFKPLRRLMARAKIVRKKELERAAQFPLNGFLGPVVSTSNNPSEILGTPTPLVDFMNYSPPSSTASNNVMQNPVQIATGQQSLVPDSMDQMVYNESSWTPDLLNVDESMNWVGWDNMVKEFEDGQCNNPIGLGMTGGMTNWW